MQSTEFDNLMNGSPAKWMESKDLFKKDDFKPTLAEIKIFERPIPEATRENIDSLVAKCRKNGMKEAKIRRIVKNTFKITVV